MPDDATEGGAEHSFLGFDHQSIAGISYNIYVQLLWCPMYSPQKNCSDLLTFLAGNATALERVIGRQFSIFIDILILTILLLEDFKNENEFIYLFYSFIQSRNR